MSPNQMDRPSATPEEIWALQRLCWPWPMPPAVKQPACKQACHAHIEQQFRGRFPSFVWITNTTVTTQLTAYAQIPPRPARVPGSAAGVRHGKQTVAGIIQGIGDVSNDETCTTAILIICTVLGKSHLLDTANGMSKPTGLTLPMLKLHSSCSISCSDFI